MISITKLVVKSFVFIAFLPHIQLCLLMGDDLPIRPRTASLCEEDVRDRVKKQTLVLENSELVSEDNLITGLVRVRNLAYEKRVVIRFSFSDWDKYSEVTADWEESVGESEPPETDRFSFAIPLPTPNRCGSVRFAIRYDVAGMTFWDNNGGQNYERPSS